MRVLSLFPFPLTRYLPACAPRPPPPSPYPSSFLSLQMCVYRQGKNLVHVCACVCVCGWVCVYACMCVCTHTHTRTHAHTFISCIQAGRRRAGKAARNIPPEGLQGGRARAGQDYSEDFNSRDVYSSKAPRVRKNAGRFFVPSYVPCTQMACVHICAGRMHTYAHAYIYLWRQTYMHLHCTYTGFKFVVVECGKVALAHIIIHICHIIIAHTQASSS